MHIWSYGFTKIATRKGGVKRKKMKNIKLEYSKEFPKKYIVLAFILLLASCKVAKKKHYEVETCQKTGIQTAIYKPIKIVKNEKKQ